MTVIFIIKKNKYFNVIEETAQTMCMIMFGVLICASYVFVHKQD